MADGRPQRDTILDFEVGIDTLDIQAFGFSSTSDFSISQSGSDVVLDFGHDNTVTLEDLTSSSLTNDDFTF